MVILPAKRAHTRDSEADNAIFETVRKTIDLWKIAPPNGERAFDDYYLSNCPSPDHVDAKKSALFYHNGVNCRACGFRVDTTTFYQMHNPTLSPFQAAAALLAGNYTLDQDAVRVKTVRELDKERADAMHLELAKRPDAIAALEKMGFEKRAIRHFRLGLSDILASVLPAEYDKLDTMQNIEWREYGEERQPFQWQTRFSVPVFEGEKLRQVILRKWRAEDLGSKVQLTAKAGTAWLYNCDALQGAEYAVVASGWGDTIALWQWGITSVCGISGDGQRIHPEWMERLGGLKRLYLVTDADAAGALMIKRWKAVLPYVRHIVLPYEEGSKKDVRDFYLEGHTAADFGKLMKEADQKAVTRALRRPR